jgi:hypothetical protein
MGLRQVRAVLADQIVYFILSVGESDPGLCHVEQYGFIVDRLDVVCQANALLGKFSKVHRFHTRSSPCGVE